MELLAPVGSKEAFVTAIRAGANAVYIGVPDFNARVSASNINLFDIRVMINHARENNVKVYLALNTLIKHEEIGAVVKSISHISKLSPDALIVQDLGLAGILRKFYPEIPLHASTQMAVHNRMGVDFMAQLGFKRAILARELSFAELKIIANGIAGGTPIGIEVFCHGALCFSLSGMCLFSSFIGGLSGNRGRCTQPCRRLWQNAGRHGYIFSPRDLELAPYVNKLKNIGIASIKIEGRMRSSEYVYKTVKAYRMLIDSSEKDFEQALKEAGTILSGDAAREKTTCLFSGRDDAMFQPKKAQCLGNIIGSIVDAADGSITVQVDERSGEILEGDRLRLSNPDTDSTVAFKVKEFTKDGLNYTIPFSKAGEFAAGNPVFKTIDTVLDQKDIEKEIDAIYDNFKNANRRRDFDEEQPSQAYTALISNNWKDIKNRPLTGETVDSLWIRFDDIGWLSILPKNDKNIRYVYYLTKDKLHAAGQLIYENARGISIELTPFIDQRGIPLFKEFINKMVSSGVNRWVLNNVSQFGLFKGLECELSAGPFLYTWNAYTAAFFEDNNIKYFTASWEDDFLNIRKMCGPGLGKYVVVYLYGYVPLARSRLLSRDMFAQRSVIKEFYSQLSASERVNRQAFAFQPVFESDNTLLIPEKPVNIFTGRRKLRECGISNFGIDLSYIKPDKKTWNDIINSFKSEENLDNTVKFNFKRGIK